LVKIVKTSLRLPEDLLDRVHKHLGRTGHQQTAVIEGLELWLKAKSGSNPIAPATDALDLRPNAYRTENLPWHDRLEMVLNDIDEALGIQKNLEWAERTVRDKQKRPAGKRASGM
jgi:hypothetical protein